MSKMIELSDSDYAAIQEAASAAGMTPDEWIVARLVASRGTAEEGVNASSAASDPNAKPAKTLADLFAGRIGRFNSGSGEPRVETLRESFGEHLEQKHRTGTL
jgi:hypothetical protein